MLLLLFWGLTAEGVGALHGATTLTFGVTGSARARGTDTVRRFQYCRGEIANESNKGKEMRI